MRGLREPNALSFARESRVRATGSWRRRVRRVSGRKATSAIRENGRRASRSIGVSSRCSRGFVTRGVRADRVGAKLRRRSCVRAGPGTAPAHAGVASQTEAQVGIAGRPLTRETSAGVVWKLSRAIRKDWQGGWKRGGHPDSAVAVADGASTPSGVEAPTQRKLGPPRRQCVNRGSGDPWLCSWIVLIAEVDERRLVRALTRSGLATRPRARVVKGRRKPARGGKTAGAVAGSQ